MLKVLIQKEFKQIGRNSFIPKILFVMPLMVILVFPWAANQEITNIQVAIVDNDHSGFSRRLTDKIAASDYFRLSAISENHEVALSTMEDDNADVILEIERDFEKRLMTEGVANVMISVNGVNIIKGGLASNYMSSIVREFATELREENATSAIADVGLNLLPVARFNPFGDYKVFMIPALLVMLLTIICGFLPTINIVSEKEIGTIEQINVTPVKKSIFILSKLIPNWILGLLIMSVYLSLAALVYGLTPAGSLLTIYLFAVIYILVVSGLGLMISNYSSTMQQAMFTMFFFMIIMIMLSGLFTPIASMPRWAQTLTMFNPLRYFIEVMRMVYLKGSGVESLYKQMLALLTFVVVINFGAIRSYKKSG
ncbi:MAG: ABC transporter permease [Candidatus Symbiothrix sp.]|nr:ABC transporter permease [Candidatus Symbiothrix sp.]